MFINHQPFLIIISSPSGAGKSTLCSMVIKNDPLIQLSVSATTRKKREKEIDGQDYFFVNQEEFKSLKVKDEFLEDAQVFDNYYGTPKGAVDESLNNGHCVMFEIDWQGARKIKEKYNKEEVVSIFILPPSIEELERRLKARAQDPQEVVQSRMDAAKSEISHYGEYDFILVNDDLNSTYQKIKSIIEAKRVSRYKKDDLQNLINQFA